MRDIGRAALDVLRAEPRNGPGRIAAVGHGTGGAVALEPGRDGAGLRAIGTVNAVTTGRPGEASRIRCPVWAGVGSEDPGMPSAQQAAFTAEMQAAGVDWRLVVYGGALHAFHHPPVGHAAVPGVGHHPLHARRAWRDIVGLLSECVPVTPWPTGATASSSPPGPRVLRASAPRSPGHSGERPLTRRRLGGCGRPGARHSGTTVSGAPTGTPASR